MHQKRQQPQRARTTISTATSTERPVDHYLDHIGRKDPSASHRKHDFQLQQRFADGEIDSPSSTRRDDHLDSFYMTLSGEPVRECPIIHRGA